MAWIAKIDRIAENPVPNDTRWLHVTFSNGATSFARSFKMVSAAFDVPAFLAGECARLDALDAATEDVQAVIGHEITAAVARPDVVKMWQARAVLRNAGLFDAVNAAITASGNAAWQEAWEYAPEISRSSPMVQAMGGALGLSAEQIDGLFAQAAALSV